MSNLSFFFFLCPQQPQSQINKCNNEKRRREQENEYIEQLGEFLQVNKRDNNATKPDKAAILNEVVNRVSGPPFSLGLFRFVKVNCVKTAEKLMPKGLMVNQHTHVKPKNRKER